MKNLVLIIAFLFANIAFSQVLNLEISGNSDITGFGISNAREGQFNFYDGHFGVIIDSNKYSSRKAVLFNSHLDTTALFMFQITQFTEIQSIGYKDGFNYHFTWGQSPPLSASPLTRGQIGICKINNQGRLIWNKLVNTNGISVDAFLSGGIISVITDSTNKFWVLINRTFSSSGSQYYHPAVFCIDTSGSILSQFDIPVQTNSVGHHLFAFNQNALAILGQEVLSDSSSTVQWVVSKYNMQLLSKRYFSIKSVALGGTLENIHKVALGPNQLRFLYGVSNQVSPSFRVSYKHRAELRDTSCAINGSLSLSNEWVCFATYLKSGELFCQTVTDSGFYLKWYFPNSLSIRQQVFEPVNDKIAFDSKYYSYLNPFISDSGNFYCAVNFYNVSVRKYFTKIYSLQNVGQVWSPWNNPTGLPSSKTPLSLHAYPNPTSGRFKLIGYKEEEGMTLRLFNNSGKEVWRGVPSAEGEVDISQLSPGLYHVEALTSSGKRWSTQVVRE